MNFREIALDAEEVEACTRYARSFGEAWVQSALEHSRATKYIKTYLVAGPYVDNGSRMCLQRATVTYKRLDGLAVTPDDLEAVEADVKGQVNEVTLLDDYTISHYWLCDSGD